MSNEVLAQVLQIVVGWKLPAIVVLIVLDWGFGVLAALRTKTFNLDELATVYKTNILPWLGGYLMLAASLGLISAYPNIFDFSPELVGPLADTIALYGSIGGAALVMLPIAKSVLSNVAKVFNGAQ